MENNLCFDDFSDIDLGRGNFIENKQLDKNNFSNNIMSAVWPGGVSLELLMFNSKYYRISVYKDDTIFESLQFKGAASVLSYVQKLTKNINDGQYNRKKTDKEKARKIIEDKQLTSYMNNTKWNVLLDIVNNRLSFPPAFIYKTLFDMPDSNFLKTISKIPSYFGDYSYEGLEYKHYLIEWIRITPKYAVNKGGRLASKIEIQDESEEFKRELKKEHILYEVDGNDVLIYGYR